MNEMVSDWTGEHPNWAFEAVEDIDTLRLYARYIGTEDDDAIGKPPFSSANWIQSHPALWYITVADAVVTAAETNDEPQAIETELEVEVWNQDHEGDVKVKVTIITDTPLEQWTDRDNARLGEFVNENYTEGDENRDVRYTFHLIKATE